MKLRHFVAMVTVAGLALGPAVTGAFAQAAAPAAPTAARDISRGTELTASDISSLSADASASRVGWVARRLIRAGEQLTEPSIAPPQLVRAGTDVTVRAESGGVIVTRAGTALTSGSLGERVRVRIDPRHIITGIVAASATVKIQ
ncbi:MAG: flagellar basal body P-ring formation chaperone FlgA [Gemmatimonadales bacterium]